MPEYNNFSLTPNQAQLEQDYQTYLWDNFQVKFNHLLTITNLPIGRTKFFLNKHNLTEYYLQFLADNFNSVTLPHLMCRNQLSIDYLGNVYDCDFNQMENINSVTKQGEKLNLELILKHNNLDLIEQIQTPNHCYGCTAGSGSSCGGAVI